MVWSAMISGYVDFDQMLGVYYRLSQPQLDDSLIHDLDRCMCRCIRSSGHLSFHPGDMSRIDSISPRQYRCTADVLRDLRETEHQANGVDGTFPEILA